MTEIELLETLKEAVLILTVLVAAGFTFTVLCLLVITGRNKPETLMNPDSLFLRLSLQFCER